jgi:polyhydroxybutyrate depolymerase
MRSFAVLMVLVTIAAGCAGDPVGGPASPGPSMVPPARSAAPAAPSAPTSESPALVVGGDRPVTVHAPADPDPSGAPLLIVLHGYGSAGSEVEGYFHLGTAAAERGFVGAYPDGTMDGDGNRFWHATDACCDFGRTGVDDAAYLAGLIGEIADVMPIDPRRVYLIGHSNGGFMSHRMACAHADVVAAIVSLAGATFVDPADCAPSEPVTVLQIHGSADDTVLFWGGSLASIGAPGESASYPGAADTVATWAAYDRCDPELVPSSTRIDVDAAIEVTGAPAEATVTASTDCDAGGHVELWTIPGGGHVPDISTAFADAVLDFLLAHPKP